MMCFIYKWLISSAVSDEKAANKFLRRHIEKCPSCMEYYKDHLRIAAILRSQCAKAIEREPAVSPIYMPKRVRLWQAGKAAAIVFILVVSVAVFNHFRHPEPTQEQVEYFDNNTSLLLDMCDQDKSIDRLKAVPSLSEQYEGFGAIINNVLAIVSEGISNQTEKEDKF